MRQRALALGVIIALGGMGLAGCDNTQGTSANPEIIQEHVDYKDNNDPQNTGAGAGLIGKPPAPPSNVVGGETASQAEVKGTDNATGISNEGGIPPSPSPNTPH